MLYKNFKKYVNKIFNMIIILKFHKIFYQHSFIHNQKVNKDLSNKYNNHNVFGFNR